MPDGWKKRNGGKNQSEKSIKGKDSKKITWDKNDKNRQKGALNIYVNVTHNFKDKHLERYVLNILSGCFGGVEYTWGEREI